MSRSRVFFAGGAVVALIIGIFIGGIFTDRDHEEMNESHHSNHAGNRFSDNDVMFAQMMVPHHQQAVVMSDLALKISTNAEVIALATAIRDAQAPEITEMKRWLSDTDSDLDMGHEMAMAGMLSDDELDKLRNSTGPAFDRLFLAGMIGHHKGAIAMVDLIDGSKNAAVKKLAADIVRTQSAEIKTMKELLARLS